MATKAEIRDRAAEILGILPIGQNLASQHATRIEASYDEIYEQLKTNGLASWALGKDVPDKLVPFVAALIADNCLETYGVSNDRYTRIKQVTGSDGVKAKQMIRKYTRPHHVSQENAVDF